MSPTLTQMQSPQHNTAPDRHTGHLAQTPWYFRLAAGRIAEGKRGGWLSLRILRAAGLLRRSAPFPLPAGGILRAPLDWPNVHSARVFEDYEPEAIGLFAEAVSNFARPATLIDAGADVGAFTLLVCGLTDNISSIHAFEPNARSCALLRRNLAQLRIPHGAQQAAIADFRGRGRLAFDPAHSHDHAHYLEPDPAGDIIVCTIDDIGLPEEVPVAMKIDVEGGEIAVLKGALRTLARAPAFVVQLEAHPEVARRTGVDPSACLRLLAGLRPIEVVACGEKQRRVVTIHSLDDSVFAQAGEGIWDLVVTVKEQ